MKRRLYNNSFFGNKNVKQVKDKRTSGLVLTYVSASFLIIIGSLFYVQQHIQLVRIGYVQQKFRKEKAELLKKNEELRLEKATLESLPRIESIAKKRLRMIEPKPGQVIYVR
ncbi:MAG: cell division protein FtsL [bacterium]